MKKILTVVTAIVLVALTAFSVCAADDITVTLNGEAVDCASYGQPATIVNGRTLVPLRAIFEALGASVEWDQATKTVTSALGDTTVELTIDIPVMYVNGEGKELDVAGTIMNGRTLVPARAVAEAFGVDVKWDAATRTVILEKSNAAPAPEGAILWNIGGKNFASIEDSSWGESNTGIQVVENPLNAGEKVLYIETNVTEKQAWNYFWFNDFEFVPGQRYLVTFSGLAGTDCFGNAITFGTVGACFNYDKADHGIGAGQRIYSDKWSNFAAIGTIPESIDLSKGNRFGVYCNPMAVEGYDHNLAWNMYIKNLSVVPYNGDLGDGVVDPALVMDPTGAGLPANFDFDKAEGDLVDLSVLEASHGHYDSAKNIYLFDSQSADPLTYYSVPFAADDYSAVAVKFSKVEAGEKAKSMQIFFMTDSQPDASENKSLVVKYVDCGVDNDGYWVAYFDFANLQTADYWNGTITKLRLDPGDDVGVYEIAGVKLIK